MDPKLTNRNPFRMMVFRLNENNGSSLFDLKNPDGDDGMEVQFTIFSPERNALFLKNEML